MNEYNSISIYVNGVLLSLRMIKKWDGTRVTSSDVSSIKLSVYKLTYDSYGEPTRTVLTGYDSLTLSVGDVIVEDTSSTYNFSYCVEGAFTESKTNYCVEYKLTMSDSHTVIIPIYAQTTD